MPDFFVIHEKEKIPFSRELLAESIAIAGTEKEKAYTFSEQIMEKIMIDGKKEISSDELAEEVYSFLDKKSPNLANKYRFWRDFKKRRDPLIILVAGGTGVGSTSVGIELSNRLKVSSISTDIIRSVLRGHISEDLRPSLHESSYLAWKHFNFTANKEKVVAGFVDHSKPIIKSVELVINRAIVEGFSVIIEGIHLVPDLISEELLKKPFVHLFALDIDVKEHKSHFLLREYLTKHRRPAKHYLQYFKEISQIQQFIVSRAKKRKVPVVRLKGARNTAKEIIKITTKNMMKDYK